MRSLRRLVIVLAAIVGAFWLLGDRLSLQKDGQLTKKPGTEKSIPELAGGVATQSPVEWLKPEDWATLSADQPTDGKWRDVTDAQRQELIDYLNARWPHITTEYDLVDVRSFGWPSDGSSVLYVGVFNKVRQLSTLRMQKPMIGCGFNFEREQWHCLSPVFETYFQWHGQEQPVEVHADLSDELAYVAMANFAEAEHALGHYIKSIMPDPGSGPDVIRISIIVPVPGSRGNDEEYRYYRYRESKEHIYEFVPVNAPPPPDTQ